MTDEEFDVLDEMYFVQSFEELVKLTGKHTAELIPILDCLYQRGWIKVLRTMEEEVSPEQVDLKNKAGSYFYLASKAGLKAHNS